MTRHVDTPYGPMPGCPDCGMIALTGHHICEHGVTAPSEITATASATVEDPELYRRLLGDES